METSLRRKVASVKSRPPGPRALKRSERKSRAKRLTEVPKRWIWHYQTLSSLRDELIRERKERLSEAAQPMESHSMSMADSATDEFDHELALSRLSVDQDALYEVEAAMKRILDGTYGICEQTGRAIPAARLKVLPWTRFRKEVASRLERTGVIFRTRLGRLGSVRDEAAGALAENEPTVDQPSPPTLNDLPPEDSDE